ncbi:hypothetical protein ZOSMA_1285G00010 [Zostera marina]|uniref:Nucleoporin Nup133/Nup155-like N-terminal domain-containing protein n=1 Tax=Zostera marina TaxID=29655 RepID=A0A0K9Q1Z9_ZOSMR|nr:hypothetical protein ZOSMA_1285G00010 [Zostera marina]
MAWLDEILGPDVTSAGLHVSDYICRDASWILDLEEGLETSSGLLLAEVVGTRKLPPVLNERYNASGGEGTALCGSFPEIRRAWALVDNSLFLRRFDKCII